MNHLNPSFVASGPAAQLHRDRAKNAERALHALQSANAERLAAVPAIDRTQVGPFRRITLLGLLVALVLLAIQFAGLPIPGDSDVAVSYRVEQSHKASAARWGVANGNRVVRAWDKDGARA